MVVQERRRAHHSGGAHIACSADGRRVYATTRTDGAVARPTPAAPAHTDIQISRYTVVFTLVHGRVALYS